ncbi:MAG TPA: excinuclease ABC subunit UvrA, partial [Acidobacteriota bacterium]|nr:excinuclease ABC subunit UvrA [Acidobacteriota bacterium]
FFRYLGTKKYKMHVRIFIARYRGYAQCADCEGERLRPEARDVYVGGKRISQLTGFPISDLYHFFQAFELPSESQAVAGKIVHEIRKRLLFLKKVGLQYLTLDRLTSTLSGGETQRIHLAASLGSSLVGTLYVLDEPSIGLHLRDQERLVEILSQLRDLGNTIVVVEHEREIIHQADYVIDMGPGAGENGGEVIHQGDVASLLDNDRSVTGRYLSGQLRIPTPVFRRSPSSSYLLIRNAREHNLKRIDVKIPLGVLTCITGVSGSGKSTLVHDVIHAGLKKQRGEWKGSVGAFDSIEGGGAIADVILVDQSPIGRTPRSNPVTYVKAFDEIRKLFAAQREAQAKNLSPAHFSFNVSGGRCETCQGTGTVTVEMQFLADVQLVCEDCGGKRFTQRVLDVTYRGHNIDSVLNMTVQQAIAFFSSETSLVRKLKVLEEVGLGYLRLGQPATTLSGGEAQRIKLASYLARKAAGNSLFILDEPTTGLHFEDIHKLLRAFDRLISQGASLIVIEHNLDVIKSADWIIDLGPEGGDEGGEVVAAGTPEEIARCDRSHTGRYLRSYLFRQEEIVSRSN